MTGITTAFTDAIHDSQACFRRLLTAMSEPGTRVELDRAGEFGDLSAGTVQVLLTLADSSTRLWLSSTLREDQTACDNLRFHVAAPLVEQASGADFAVLSQADLAACGAVLQSLPMGCEEYPDQGATLVIETDSLAAGPELVLSGPGIPERRPVRLGSLPQALVRFLSERDLSSPLGIDLIFVCDRELVAIPRSTRVEV
ncbi:phosphonate C-P lyase system protein PhnH [Oceanisphaera arctica]|uniref:Phosphonate C-P lyase system protein PhnH n=1 Tax=Oceanisphaera arctica TaxID=641510 RepID=A0A2P5TNP7_9GAMM|nr:phosphonate C-P lyase system protein PhnH [Oceanisphaera arctica]PPL17234.1 phosphonate C-P lyase system protein PhnH [Oceanisphaera arctica]GHA20374.1 carbon-phosphorus lyase subunit PhnH [Oceanisphaera arctica]